MSSGVFTGKESSNRIELSRLVQDLLNFGVLGSLQLWGWVDGGIGGGGAPHTCTHACICTHACTHMYRNCKWLPTWRHPCLLCLACLCMCMHVCACMCVHVYMGHPPTHPYPPTLIYPSATPQGDPRNQLKFDNTWTNQDISILFKYLKSVNNFSPMNGCMVWWVGGWLGGLMGGIRSKH